MLDILKSLIDLDGTTLIAHEEFRIENLYHFMDGGEVWTTAEIEAMKGVDLPDYFTTREDAETAVETLKTLHPGEEYRIVRRVVADSFWEEA